MDLHLAHTLKIETPKALATLIRLLGDFDLAEDVLQDALLVAVEKWPAQGIPESPAAWLVSTAKFKSVSRFRKSQVEQSHRNRVLEQEDESTMFPDAEEHMERAHLNDDLLRLIFTCCHPVLPIESQLALTLKTVVGLRSEEVARAFLVPTRTMEQRLVRAKKKIREAQIPFEIPERAQLAERLEAVLWAIYLIFNEGYSASQGEALIRKELCHEAIRLARTVHRLFRGESEVVGLLALLLLQKAREPARVDALGCLVPLDEQDRSLWETSSLYEGCSLVEKALGMKRPGPYQIMASIAALHNQAKKSDLTDWLQISMLYVELEKFWPTAIVKMNLAIAIAMEEGAEMGLKLLDRLKDLPELKNYHLFHASRGALLQKQGRLDETVEAFHKALRLTQNPSEIAYLKKKLKDLS